MNLFELANDVAYTAEIFGKVASIFNAASGNLDNNSSNLPPKKPRRRRTRKTQHSNNILQTNGSASFAHIRDNTKESERAEILNTGIYNTFSATQAIYNMLGMSMNSQAEAFDNQTEALNDISDTLAQGFNALNNTIIRGTKEQLNAQAKAARAQKPEKKKENDSFGSNIIGTVVGELLGGNGPGPGGGGAAGSSIWKWLGGTALGAGGLTALGTVASAILTPALAILTATAVGGVTAAAITHESNRQHNENARHDKDPNKVMVGDEMGVRVTPGQMRDAEDTAGELTGTPGDQTLEEYTNTSGGGMGIAAGIGNFRRAIEAKQKTLELPATITESVNDYLAGNPLSLGKKDVGNDPKIVKRRKIQTVSNHKPITDFRGALYALSNSFDFLTPTSEQDYIRQRDALIKAISPLLEHEVSREAILLNLRNALKDIRKAVPAASSSRGRRNVWAIRAKIFDDVINEIENNHPASITFEDEWAKRDVEGGAYQYNPETMSDTVLHLPDYVTAYENGPASGRDENGKTVTVSKENLEKYYGEGTHSNFTGITSYRRKKGVPRVITLPPQKQESKSETTPVSATPDSTTPDSTTPVPATPVPETTVSATPDSATPIPDTSEMVPTISPEKQKDKQGNFEYTLQKGEDLVSVAKKFGLSKTGLIVLNGRSLDWEPHVGEKIKVRIPKNGILVRNGGETPNQLIDRYLDRNKRSFRDDRSDFININNIPLNELDMALPAGKLILLPKNANPNGVDNQSPSIEGNINNVPDGNGDVEISNDKNSPNVALEENLLGKSVLNGSETNLISGVDNLVSSTNDGNAILMRLYETMQALLNLQKEKMNPKPNNTTPIFKDDGGYIV